MALIFLVFLFALLAAYLRKRTWTIALVSVGLLLSLMMFWYHITDVLKINL